MLRHRRDMVLALVAAVLGSACQVLVPLVERQIVDDVILDAQLAAVAVAGRCCSASAAATFGFAYLRRYRGGRVALEVQYDLRNDMHAHLQTMDFANLDRMPTGQLVGARELRLGARPGPAELLPDHERQRAADGAVARS